MIAEILSWLSLLIVGFISRTGYWGIMILMGLESANFPVPSEIVMPFSGFLVFEGRLNFLLVVLAGVLGNLLGSIFSYFLGLWGGRIFIFKFARFFIPASEIERGEKWFLKYGEKIIFFSRLLPVVRTFISFPAGIFRMSFLKFCFYTALGSIPWNFALTYVGIILGQNWTILEKYFKRFDIIIGALIVLGLIWWLWQRFMEKHKTQESEHK